jgi:hypothetical protein
MSHYTTLVILRDMKNFTLGELEEILAEKLEPFWELDLPQEEMKHNKYAEFSPEIYDGYTKFKKIIKYLRYKSSGILKVNDIKWYKELYEKYMKIYKEFPPEQATKRFMKDWYRYIYEPEYLAWGYYHNPNAKWDWYSIGGRWRGFFPLKQNASFKHIGKPGLGNNKPYLDTDVSFKRDIDFEKLKSEYNCTPSTHAILKDGKWIEKGKMGWWGAVLDEKPKCDWKKEWINIVQEAGNNDLFVIVDCHI